MLKAMRKLAPQWTLIGSILAATATAKTGIEADPVRRDVDLVIALDVSGSMSGLIDSAKQRLWDITNELERAQPTPALRVAILSYGNPGYGAQSGYVRLDLPFTADLDAVNERLFAFQTNGGDEYVARVVQTSLDALQWSRQPDALRIIFVAGNESAEQDPELSTERVMRAAAQKDIIVNAIYCGPDGDGIAPEWQRVAALANGTYASIDQNVAAVANIPTPMDAPLAALNGELNSTYLAFGSAGRRSRENQLAQDVNAAAMSAPAAASRTVAKAGALYRTDWDLVDAIESGKELEEIAPADLPVEMQAMDPAEREEYVRAKAGQRRALQQQIADLAEQRRAYIAEKRREQPANGARGLDTVMLESIRSVAEKKGFEFAKN